MTELPVQDSTGQAVARHPDDVASPFQPSVRKHGLRGTRISFFPKSQCATPCLSTKHLFNTKDVKGLRHLFMSSVQDPRVTTIQQGREDNSIVHGNLSANRECSVVGDTIHKTAKGNGGKVGAMVLCWMP